MCSHVCSNLNLMFLSTQLHIIYQHSVPSIRSLSVFHLICKNREQHWLNVTRDNSDTLCILFLSFQRDFIDIKRTDRTSLIFRWQSTIFEIYFAAWYVLYITHRIVCDYVSNNYMFVTIYFINNSNNTMYGKMTIQWVAGLLNYIARNKYVNPYNIKHFYFCYFLFNTLVYKKWTI